MANLRDVDLLVGGGYIIPYGEEETIVDKKKETSSKRTRITS
jgi:hypothetical protein